MANPLRVGLPRLGALKELPPGECAPPSADRGVHPRFRLLTDGQLDALEEPHWLIQGVLPAEALAVLYGHPGSAKSFLALDWAFSIAADTRFWHGRDVLPGAVVFVAAEGLGGLKHRVDAWKEANGYARDLGVLFLPEPVDMLTLQDPTALLAAVREVSPDEFPALLVLDTLALNMPGGNENDAKDMNAFVAGANYLRRQLRATVLTIHHPGKPKPGEQLERGNSALRGAADSMFELSRDGDELTLKCTKQRDAVAFDPPIRLALTPKGKSCVITSAAQTAAFLQAVPTRNERNALEILQAIALSDGMSTGAWLRSSGLPERSFYASIKGLVTKDLVSKLSRGKYAVSPNGIDFLTATASQLQGNCNGSSPLTAATAGGSIRPPALQYGLAGPGRSPAPQEAVVR